MIEITKKPISPELVVNKIKTDSSGCVVTYVGLIREHSLLIVQSRSYIPHGQKSISFGEIDKTPEED